MSPRTPRCLKAHLCGSLIVFPISVYFSVSKVKLKFVVTCYFIFSFFHCVFFPCDTLCPLSSSMLILFITYSVTGSLKMKNTNILTGQSPFLSTRSFEAGTSRSNFSWFFITELKQQWVRLVLGCVTV